MKITDLYESEFLTDKDEILKWMNESCINFDSNNLIIEHDGLVYNGTLNLKQQHVDKLKVQFKLVTKNFNCLATNLINLEGSPQAVGGDFSCSHTNITSLKYCPKSVGGYFSCQRTRIIDLREYRYVLYCEIGDRLYSGNEEVNEIINTYGGSANRKYWPKAINLLSKVQL